MSDDRLPTSTAPFVARHGLVAAHASDGPLSGSPRCRGEHPRDDVPDDGADNHSGHDHADPELGESPARGKPTPERASQQGDANSNRQHGENDADGEG
jgi:hypothetical protein